MTDTTGGVDAVDRFQQRQAWLAVPVATWKKFQGDQAGNLAALIAYYGFVALFTLLLVLVTVLNITLKNDPALQRELLNFGVIWLGFRLATLGRVAWPELWTGAAIAAVVWQVPQLAGGYLVGHQLRRSSERYGTFGVVLGLLAWLYLEAQVTLYAAEVDVVLRRRLWPRSLKSDEGGRYARTRRQGTRRND